jgi:UDP-2-acetamido-2-deoxy-ribo-hexuluronate aminotransferase
MPDQPWYAEQIKQSKARIVGDIAQARWAAEHVISLPIFPDMTDAMIEQVIGAVRKALN